MITFNITNVTIIEKLSENISPGLCQTNMFYSIWSANFVGQRISDALQHFI